MKKYLALFLIICLFICGCENKKDVNNNDNKNEDITQKSEGTFNETNDFTFNLDIKDKKHGDEVTYKLNDKYTVKLSFKIDEYNDEVFDVYVNDTFVLTDSAWEGSINFYTLSDSLIYINSGFTDIRCEKMYVINDRTITKLYELDNVKGMVPYEIKVNKDSVVIKASRLSHGETIIYGDSTEDIFIEDKESWKKAGITENTIIEATYTYTIKNNRLNMVPTITDKIRLKNYEY